MSSDSNTQLLKFQFPLNIGGVKPKTICGRAGELMFEMAKFPNPWAHMASMNFFQSVARGGSFVEVGANIGTTTIFAADFFKTVYAFEPDPQNVNILNKAIELNALQNVKVLPVALGDKTGSVNMASGGVNSGGSAVLSDGRPGSIALMTLSEALPDVRDVTLLQIDTEGWDTKVLDGAREFLKRQFKLPIIITEFQPRLMVQAGSNADELLRFISDFSFQIMFLANGNMSPMNAVVIGQLFDLWKNGGGWIDLYLYPTRNA
jgi:FkbM family methyltransferase